MLKFLPYCKPKWHNKANEQMRVGARDCFAYPSARIVLLANGNRYEVDSNTFSKW